MFALKSFVRLSFYGKSLHKQICTTGISYEHNKRNKSTESFNETPSNVPLVEENIGNLIANSIEIFSDREAVVDCEQGIRKTFAQYVADIDRFAAGLLALRLNQEDRIGLWSPNRYEWTVAAFAAAKAGLILVPLNPANQVRETEYCLQKLKMRALIVSDTFKTQNYYEMMGKIIPEIETTKVGENITSKKHPYFDTLILMSEKNLPGAIRFTDVEDSATNENMKKLETIKIEPRTAAYIMFTSGTTGKPKAAATSHFTIVNSLYQDRKRFLYDQNELMRICCPPPLFHIFGYATMIAGMGNGSTLVLPSKSYSADACLEAIDKEKCSALQGTTTMFADMLDHPKSKTCDFTSLQKIQMAGSLCSPTLLKRIQNEWKCSQIVTAYGSTETCGAVTSTLADGSFEQVLESCGTPITGMKIKLVDENGNIIPRGSKGEILVKGFKVMLGYWEDEDENKKVFTSDGWYRTGDIGIMLENGCLQIVDRIKDMIIRGGENVYPKEVEELLMEHSKISEAYVFGIPNERLGEEICAWIRLVPGEKMIESDVTNFCKGKLAHFKIPRYIKFVEQFPKTLSGKVQKFIMKEEEVKQLKV